MLSRTGRFDVNDLPRSPCATCPIENEGIVATLEDRGESFVANRGLRSKIGSLSLHHARRVREATHNKKYDRHYPENNEDGIDEPADGE